MKTTGEYAQARDSYERALAIAEKILGPTHPFTASCVNNLGLLSRTLGDYSSARTYYDRALQMNERIHGLDHPYTASTLKNLGDLVRLTGASDEARSLYERALEIREKAFGPLHPEVGVSHQVLGKLLADNGEWRAARAHYEKTLRIWAGTLPPDHPDVADTLAGFADLLWRNGEAEEAQAKYARALEIWEKSFGAAHPRTAELLRDIAALHLKMGEQIQALAPALRAESVAREHLRITVATLPERQALRYASVRARGLDVALTLLSGPPRNTIVPEVWDALIRSRALILDEMATRRRSLGRSTDPESSRLLQELNASSRRLANLALAGPDPHQPEAMRRLIKDALHKKEQIERLLSEKSIVFRQQQAWRQAGLKDVRESLPRGSVLLAYVLFEREEEAVLTPKSSPVGVPRHPADMDSKVPGRVPFYLVFILRSDGDAKVLPLGPASPIHGFIERWSDTVALHSIVGGCASKAGLTEYRRAGDSLRRRIWDPIAGELVGAERVFVVPDGMLHLVDFNTLPVGDFGYLIEQRPIIHYFSAERDVVAYKVPRSGIGGLLAIGNPDFEDQETFAALRPPAMDGRQDPGPSALREVALRGNPPTCASLNAVRFEPLPSSEREVAMIAGLWSGSRQDAASVPAAVVLTGPAASEANFKLQAPGRRILHLATHGYFLGGRCPAAGFLTRGIGGLAPADKVAVDSEVVSENPLLLSGLALAGANSRGTAGPDEDDGILSAEEVAAMDLAGVEWAVLSACDTAAGQVSAGEGVFGLRRAFQVAGAATVIMSLWSVADDSAREWMTALYESHLIDRLGTAEAVRAAGLRLLNRRRQEGASTHPFCWGGWVAAGDWR
jgi:CHAT domain-containing protein/tetratricopeptide (TPR) repeat protein